MEYNKKFWDKSAKFYTFMHEKRNKKLYESLSIEIKKYLKKEYSVLELACGTGQLSFSLCDLVQSYIATDYSINMINNAKKRNSSQNIVFDVVDATALKYDNNCFDVVIMANALHIIPDPKKAINELKRVLKDDGLLILPTFVYDKKSINLKIKILELFGFKTYNKWTSNKLIEFLKTNDLNIVKSSIIKSNLLPESFIVCRK